MSAQLWQFTALDRLFFRDGRPFNNNEMTWQESQFPPSGRTLQGAIRTAVLQHLGADFAKFAEGEPCYIDELGQQRSLKEQLGKAGNLGRLALTGPFVMKDGGCFFPAPLDLVRMKDGGFDLLCVCEDQPVTCDMGQVVLPRASSHGVKAQEGMYLSYAVMARYLAGDVRGIRPAESPNDRTANLWPLRASGPNAPGLVDVDPRSGWNATTTHAPLKRACSTLSPSSARVAM